MSLSLIGISSVAAATPIQIDCGNDDVVGIHFTVEPALRTLQYQAFEKGKQTSSGKYRPSPGIYDQASLTFSGNSYRERVQISGHYSEVLRINHFRTFTLALSKDNSAYKLHAFTQGSLLTSEFTPKPIPQQINPAYTGLSCEVREHLF